MSTQPIPTHSPEFLAEDIGPSLIATASVFIVLSTAFVFLRYYARYITNTRFGAEDVIIPFAWLAEVGLCITAIVMVKKAGTGRHMDYVAMTDPKKISEHFKGIMVNEILHLPAVAFPKLCVVVLYLRVFTNKWARMATWALIYIISATWFSYTIAAMFQCIPFQFNWDKSIPNGRCFNVSVFAMSSSVPNIVTDVAVLFLPIRTIVDLKVSVGKRIGLFLIFLTGSVGIIASIIRTVVFSNIDPLADVTYKHVQLINWTIIEPGLYLLAACALSFKPLFRMLAHALKLDSLLTHTRSLTGRKTKSGHITGTAHSGLHLDTMKSTHGHAGFKKLGSNRGTGDGDEEAIISYAKDGGSSAKKDFEIMVTRTVDMDVETRSSDEYELQDRSKFVEASARAV